MSKVWRRSSFFILVYFISEATFAVTCPYAPVQASPDIIGTALAQTQQGKDTSVLYCEFHYLSHDKSGVEVLFQRESGSFFATKTLSYRSTREGFDMARPNVWQFDVSNNELRIARWQDNNLYMGYGFEETPASPQVMDALEKQVVIDEAKVDVIDGGFDDYVRKHWSAIVSGKPVDLKFASPVHQRSLPLQVVKKEAVDCPSIGAVSGSQAGGRRAENLICLHVRVKNPMLRWFVEPLRLVYSAESQKLLVYEGVVNLLDKGEKSMDAAIFYQYQ